uniref:BEACH domain-containing protein n=1 Tax=Globisporangium ultimum (strain ATCC 200006 / CBS 805.95 / DAOM BR144) TaxID=431595 RepID=K3WMD0_GLOUD
MRATSKRPSRPSIKSAHATRFNLLLLEDGEYFLDGRLKVCTRGLFFVPHDIVLPILRFPFRAMTAEPFTECFVDPFAEQISDSYINASKESMYVTFQTTQVVEMRERGIDHPYVYKDTSDPASNSPSKFMFTLLYSKLDTFLSSIHVIYEVAKLPRRSMNKVDEENLLATVLAPRLTENFDTSLLVDFRERLLLPKAECVDRIEPLLKFPGCIMLTNSRLYFQPAKLNNVLDPVLTWEYREIEHIFKRRYLLRQTGLEIYLVGGGSYFFSFKSRQDRDDIYAMMADQPDLQHCQREDLEVMMRKWQTREISNFEYLVFLNNASGRTRNDLTQYPVFPWILSDYTSSSLDLSDPSVYRDLSKPIGALNEQRLEYFKMRYEVMPRGEEAEGMPPPFLYGTHYSTPGYVLYFLVRLVPQCMLCLQNGKFDAADRLFRSIDVTWQGCNSNHTDVKELIPEFFDESISPDGWLRNWQNLDLGTTQNLRRVDGVELPPWAHNDPHEFIQKNRAALESDYVSEHLHEWIDLIFGFKQQGEEAIRANNLFYYLSYEGSIDLETVVDPMEKCSIESQIQEFGQTPKLLFSTPHPSRIGKESQIKIATPDLLPSPQSSSSSTLHDGEITSAVLSRDDATLFTTCKDRTLKISTLDNGDDRVQRTLSSPFALSCCDLSPNERVIFVGCWDNRVYMYSARSGQEMDKVFAHSDGISAICVVGGNRFLTSSWDSTVKLWRYTPTFIVSSPVYSVLCLDTSPNGAFGAAGTRNGHVYLFDLNRPAFRIDVFVSPTRRGDVSSISFTADGNSYVCMTIENELLQYNLQGEQLFSMDVSAPGQIRCFESDGEFAVGGTTNGQILFWKLHEEPGNELVYEIPNAHDTIISTLTMSTSGSTLVSGAIDGSVKIWNLARDVVTKKSEKSRKTSAASATSTAKLTEASFSGVSSMCKKKMQQQRQTESMTAAEVYRATSIYYRPLHQVYSTFAMDESQYFLEG